MLMRPGTFREFDRLTQALGTRSRPAAAPGLWLSAAAAPTPSSRI